ncbi:MAG: SMP-30/gluconolactonase/LRE family protein [Dehalococcoidales bacterium]|nr:SMP-30/gluconolactonase/LRE family protein [Dehalococcoidales bacterium]
MTCKTEVLLEGLTFAEGPRWHDGKLWFSDFYSGRVMTVDMSGKAETVVEVPGVPSGLGWLPDGRLLVVSMMERRLLRLDPGGLTEVADLGKLTPYNCNDMVVDKQGRAYIGHFGYDFFNKEPLAPASIIMVTPDGGMSVVADDMYFPNGSVITPDGRTLIVAETMGSRLTAFDIESGGSLAGRRVWAKLGETIPPGLSEEEADKLAAENVFPDGICLDAENAVWVADASGKQVIRVREGGEVTDRVELSGTAVACMLGGPDRRTLFIMAAVIPQSGETGVKPGAHIEIVKVEVPGAGLP